MHAIILITIFLWLYFTWIDAAMFAALFVFSKSCPNNIFLPSGTKIMSVRTVSFITDLLFIIFYMSTKTFSWSPHEKNGFQLLLTCYFSWPESSIQRSFSTKESRKIIFPLDAWLSYMVHQVVIVFRFIIHLLVVTNVLPLSLISNCGVTLHGANSSKFYCCLIFV